MPRKRKLGRLTTGLAALVGAVYALASPFVSAGPTVVEVKAEKPYAAVDAWTSVADDEAEVFVMNAAASFTPDVSIKGNGQTGEAYDYDWEFSPLLQAELNTKSYPVQTVVLVDQTQGGRELKDIPAGLMTTFRQSRPNTPVFTDYGPCAGLAMHQIATIGEESRRYTCVSVKDAFHNPSVWGTGSGEEAEDDLSLSVAVTPYLVQDGKETEIKLHLVPKETF